MENNFKIAVPDGCSASITREDGYLVISFEPERWKDGDIVAFGKRPSDPSIGIFKSDDGNTVPCAVTPFIAAITRVIATIIPVSAAITPPEGRRREKPLSFACPARGECLSLLIP